MTNRIKGSVKFFKEDKGYGFIQPEDGGNDVFVHISDVRDSGFDSLGNDDVVEFSLGESNNGKSKATNLQILN